MSKFNRIAALSLILVLLLSLVGAASAQDMKVLRTEIGESDVPTLDPAIATDTSSIEMLNQTYIGLTVLDEETVAVRPGLATEWAVTANDDGTTTYVFTLLQNVPWVVYNADSGAVEQVTDADGNVRFVTAHDFVYGWRRTLDPATAGDYAYVLAPQVVGGLEFNGGEGSGDGVQISAVDDYTLQVVAPNNFSFTPNVYGLWMALPQPQWVIEEAGEFWIEAGNFQSFGPYALKEWPRGESITLIKNPFWPGTEAVPQAKIDELTFFILPTSTALAQYEAGDLDRLDTVSLPDIPRIKADPTLSLEYSEGPQLCSYYYGLSVGIEPMDNVHLRRALSYAIDREDIVTNVTGSGQVAARQFSNPALNAAPKPEDFPDLGIGYDPAMAQEELALALEEMGLSDVSELPPVSLLFNTSESHQRIAEAVQSMWSEELGIDVQLTNQEFATYLDQRATFPIWRGAWCQDFPDAHNFLFDVFHSSSNNNDTGWTSEAFDALVEEASTETDLAARVDLYAQAEQLLVHDDAVMIPIYFYASNEMTKPYVERTYSVTGTQNFYKWDINR